MKSDILYFTNKGTVRKRNEDSILIGNKIISSTDHLSVMEEKGVQDNIFAVADGMGGHKFGSLASRRVLELLLESKESLLKGNAKEVLNNLKQRFNKENLLCEGMGSTLSGIIFNESGGRIFHIGDSRVYRIIQGYFEKVTIDHSFVQELFNRGIINEEEMNNHPKRHIITSAIICDEQENIPKIFMKDIKLKHGNKYFICSDGLWEKFFTKKLENIFNEYSNSEFMEKLLNTSILSGCDDNLSAVLININ